MAADVHLLIMTTKNALQEISKQALNLGLGLQNAAPGQSGAKPGNSVQYLLDNAKQLDQSGQVLTDLLSKATDQDAVKTLEIVQRVVNQDQSLRESYAIGEKFRFVRDRLQTLLIAVEQAVKEMGPVIKSTVSVGLEADEVFVYIYLFNAHGMVLKNWLGMFTPKQFKEYGFNRPVYAEKEHIEALMRSKSSKTQHGFITVAVKQDAILPSAGLNDALGNPQIKLKEGALRFEKLFAFTYNDQRYRLTAEGNLEHFPENQKPDETTSFKNKS